MTRRATLFVVLLVVAVATAACGGGVDTQHSLVTATEANDLVQDPPDDLVILDIRTPEEFEQGRIEDSVMIDFYAPDFESQLDDLDKSIPYFVYCRSGNRSATAAEMMTDLGFEVIYELDGGIVAWAEAGLPYVSS